MKSTPVALVNHYAGKRTTLCTCWKVTLTDGTVRGFTNLPRDLVIGGITYEARSGFTASDLVSSAGLNVDNMEVSGMLRSPSITEEDLRRGLWDWAKVSIFMVNYKDLSMGRHILPGARLGNISTGRDTWRAEVRGLKQMYELTVVRMYTPNCTAILGDDDCMVDMTPFTHPGTVTGVNPDNITFYDTSLTQDGPTGGVGITGITNAVQAVISLADKRTYITEQQVVVLSGIVGMAVLNSVVTVHAPASNGLSFKINVDTTDTAAYPPYVSGGTVTPQGGDSGYFDNGMVTWLSGLNIGRKMEVGAYVPGQVRLMLDMPDLIAIGDDYEIKAGCDHTFPTCRDKYTNWINFQGFPYLPGQDRVLLIGRAT